jgi:DNA-binding winged helix-turn-helix (wHTH) protein
VEVALVHWPAEQDRREELRRAGQPRLLLVERGAPPIPTDELEDWIRLPADDLDLRVRVEALRRRTGSDAGTVPVLDDDGVLRLGDRWVSLPPVEARLTAALLERFGAVVSRDALARSGWPGGSPGRNALDVHVLRLRRRLSPLRLAIRTVRSRGYLLERADGNGQVASDQVRPAQQPNGLRRMPVA